MEALEQSSVLVVDDTEENIDILVEALGDSYDVSVAMDGQAALEIAAADKPDLILLDIMMPGMDGYEVCRRLKQDKGTQKIPVVFLTAMSQDQDEARGLKLGAVDYITKPFNPQLVKARVNNHLQLKQYRDHLEELVGERTRQLELTQEVTIESMATLAEYRDPETGGHIRRTKVYVLALAEALRNHPKFKDFLTDKNIELLYKSAPLHDIGKVGVRDNILLKPGKLTNEEFEEMKKHTIYGRDAIAHTEKRLGTASFLRFAKEIAESHQEKWDGSGYPNGLAGEDIPISGRIMAVADVYDALISKRIYKTPIPHPIAVNIIKDGRGSHFDPDMADAFAGIQEQFRQIALKHADYEEEREALRNPL
ncbi:MAG: two-component system response regulator [Deltaproteobacteria bacterium]|nr:two-component system response regulator [Deltaproteobacteria bacterium]